MVSRKRDSGSKKNANQPNEQEREVASASTSHNSRPIFISINNRRRRSSGSGSSSSSRSLSQCTFIIEAVTLVLSNVAEHSVCVCVTCIATRLTERSPARLLFFFLLLLLLFFFFFFFGHPHHRHSTLPALSLLLLQLSLLPGSSVKRPARR